MIPGNMYNPRNMIDLETTPQSNTEGTLQGEMMDNMMRYAYLKRQGEPSQ